MKKLYDFEVNLKSFWITVNRNCNFRCKWCYAENTGYCSNDDMSIEKAKQIVDLATEIDIKHITIIGGEPTLWNGLFELNDYCREKCINTSMLTNACRFGDNIYWKEYQKHSCDSVGISIKAANEAQFHNLVSKSPLLYAQTGLGIHRAIDRYPEAGVSTVWSKLISNHNLLEIAHQAKISGAKSFMISLCTATLSENGASGEHMLNAKDLVIGLTKIYPILDELYSGKVMFELSMPLCIWPQKFIENLVEKGQLLSTCHVQERSGLVFDINGDVLPCNSMLNAHIAKWSQDFYDGGSLLRHLRSQRVCDDYKQLLRYPADCCSECSMTKYCRGGCILNWMLLDPSICQPFND